ncbi:MAG: hypothetical protein AAF333_01910 [Planctomycetota bacterium]
MRCEKLYRTSTRAAALAVVGLVWVGCTARVGGDGRSLSQHNDELRRANAELRTQLDQTQAQIKLLEGELASHRQRTAAAGAAMQEGVVVPTLSGLAFARYSGPVDTDGDGADDAVRLYLRPLDQRGRMLVVAGEANVQVVELRAQAVPRVVADRTFGAREFAGTYRSGLTGDHFTLDVAMPAGDLGEAAQVTVRATLTQADTGVSVSEQAAFAVAR